MKTMSTLMSNSYSSCNTKSSEKIDNERPVNDCEKESPVSETSQPDQWLGVVSRPIRQIPHTPYFLSRLGSALEPVEHDQRLNQHGYDRDEPKDAIMKFEQAHTKSSMKKAWDLLADSLFNVFTFCVPKALSISAGKDKQRIDQKVVLRIVREAVDKFPELKIRIAKEAFDLMDIKDQLRWHKKMSIIRAAQHDYIVNALAQVYPNHIDQNAPTILYSGGRATGLLRVLYCSVDEYIALYWSDWGLISTDSGSYKAHVYDYITEGQNINWNARYLNYQPKDFEITEPGEYTFLGKGDRKIWSFEGPCGMVDHGIGNIISMSPYAIISNLTTTLNFTAIGNLLSKQAQAVAKEYGMRLKETLGSVNVSVMPVHRVDEQKVQRARDFFAKILERANGM